MLQFNLLPDVKIEYVKARQTQRIVIGTSIIAIIAAVGVTLLLAGIVYGVQKKSLSDLDSDVHKYSSQLKSVPDLGKILTIQNQLGALSGLHQKKIVSSRVFKVVEQTTPDGVTISDVATDFTANTMSISGAAASLDEINVFTDTLKYATFGEGSGQSIKPFTDVVLAQFSRSEGATSYTITLSFDPSIFSIQTPYDLTVPKKNTTNSITGQPADIFKQSTNGS